LYRRELFEGYSDGEESKIGRKMRGQKEEESKKGTKKERKKDRKKESKEVRNKDRK
jgi:hypothetical protein